MPIVIRHGRQPDGFEQFGRGIQDTINQYQQGNVALFKEQDLITREMLNMALQDRRMKDANARDERRWGETKEMQERGFAQQDKWRQQDYGLRQQDYGLRQQELGLRQAAQARAQAAQNKPIFMTMPDGYGGATPGFLDPINRTFEPLNIPGITPPGQSGGAPSENPQLSAALDDMGGAMTNNAPAQTTNPDMLTNQLNQFRQSVAQPVDLSGLSQKNTSGMTSQQIGQPVTPEWGQNYGTRAAQQPTQTMPQAGMQAATPPAPQAGSQTGGGGLQPGTVIDAQGRPVDVDPRRARWGAQQKMYFDGKEYMVRAAQSPYGVITKIDSLAPTKGDIDFMPMDASARKEAFEIRNQWDNAGRMQRSVNDFEKSGGNGGTGFVLGMMPQTVANRLDKGGIDLRSAISQFSSVLMNYLSGAAVSEPERKRLEGFLPTVSDDLETIKKKMNGYKDYMATKGESWRNTYGPIKPLEDIQLSGGSNVIRYDANGKRIQ